MSPNSVNSLSPLSPPAHKEIKLTSTLSIAYASNGNPAHSQSHAAIDTAINLWGWVNYSLGGAPAVSHSRIARITLCASFF